MDRPGRAFRSSLQNGGAMPELRISTEKVCALIEAAREVAGKVPSTAGDKTTTGDDSEPVTIEDPERIGENEDAPLRGMSGFLPALNWHGATGLVGLRLR